MSDGEASTSSAAEFTAVLVLPHGAEAAGIARRFVAEHAASLPVDLIGDAQLLVSEIVANAVRYGRPEVTLRVRLDPPAIGVTVTDTGPELPVLPAQPPDPTQTTGRGLLILDALASDWGVAPTEPPPGKAVWFELGAEPGQ